MATGSYNLGAIVRIPIQVNLDGIPTHPIPIVEKIIKPNGLAVSGLPVEATLADATSSTYYHEFIPDLIGDYIVIIKTHFDENDYYSYENFTVSSSSNIKSAPRAEPR
jgi:hypothetical protein